MRAGGDAKDDKKEPTNAAEIALVDNDNDPGPPPPSGLPNASMDNVCLGRVEFREPPASLNIESSGSDRGGGGVAASAGGLAGFDLSGAAVATAEVALAALAKVIEDRAKRESLVWFLEKMHTKICGNDEDEKTDQALNEYRAKLAPVESTLTQACQAEWDAEVRLTRAKAANRPDAPTLALKRNEKVQARQKAAEDLKALRDQGPACGPDCQTRREVRTYWLPTTCRLAKDRMDYVQYGGGASLVRALQGAVSTDVRGWPSQMAGFGVGSVYFLTGTEEKDKSQRQLKDMFECGTAAADDKLCTPTLEIRKATAKLVGQIQTGVDPTAAMYAFSAEVNRLNVNPVSPEKGTLHNIPFETAACLVSLPRVFQSLGEQVRATTEGKIEEVEALLYTGLVGAPACFTITGNGYDRDSCPGFKPGTNADTLCTQTPTLHRVLDRGEKLERLTTLVRWYATAGPSTDRILVQWENVRTAWENFYAAAETLRKSGGGVAFVPPEFDSSQVNNAKTFAEVMKAFDAYMKDAARAAQQTSQVKLLQAGAALARASLEFGVILTDSLGKITQPQFYPGLGLESTPVSEVFKITSVRLSEMVRYVATAESALNQDWGAVVASIVASVRTVVESRCKADDQCKQLVERLSRYSGLFSALISERDPDKVAEALDAAAMPLGGWRQKQIPESRSLTITSFAGMGTGMEWRWGQYGVTREGGRNVYWAPPTLQLPVGIDYAHGYKGGSWGIFIPLIDPAAYLNYDPDKQGRLPGAQLVTVLAPGLAGRVSLGETPFALTVYAIFRPALRAWESDVTSPGANALQLGASLSVDVTLFELWADRKH
ncbi:MAG: hypothetical protein IPK82_08820 [Polyangiaceae bacterium]|nr:hypothetical protein [Polyangiaceae bacterium]